MLYSSTKRRAPPASADLSQPNLAILPQTPPHVASAIRLYSMIIGNAPHLHRDQCLNTLSVQVLASIRQEIAPTTWRYTLCSPFWRLYRHHAGGAWLIFDGQRIDIVPGDLVLIPAHLIFDVHTACPLRQDYLHFNLFGIPPSIHRELFPRPATLGFGAQIAPLVMAWSDSIRNECRDPSTENMVEPPPGDAADLREYMLASALAGSALAELIAGFDDKQRERCRIFCNTSERIRPAVEAIESNLAAPGDNQTLAGLCHLSRTQFIRVFSAATGMTPAQYRIDLRLQRACGLLARSDASIERIAADLGFTDRAHLTKMFLRRYQLTPVAYRRQFTRC